MQWHNIFFFAVSGFILGAVSGGLGLSSAAALIFVMVALGAVFFLRMYLCTSGTVVYHTAISIIVLFFLAGNVYYSVDDYIYHAKRTALEGATYFEGIVIDEPQRRNGNQTAKIRIASSQNNQIDNARALLYVSPYPELSYGDVVQITGDIALPPSGSYGDYLAKERIHATMYYPAIRVMGNSANPFFSTLYKIRLHMNDVISRRFTQRQATFLSGILFGDRGEFSKEFLDKLSISGTLHVTALSGFNIAIIVFFAFAVFSVLFFGKRLAVFGATFLMVTFFVAMTGFTVSALRAAMMACIAGLADQMGRLYNPRNAIAFAAAAITFANPKAPVFDLGFQLSFAATLSIIYFAPVLRRRPFFKAASFLSWRDALAITIAAQLGVVPITITSFQNFSFSALPANIAILAIMPLLMVLGFTTVAASFVFTPLSILLSKPTAFLLDYSAGVVEVFYRLRVPFNPDVGVVAAIAYYALLIYFCARHSPHEKFFMK